jgi:hypothetical protein
MGNRESLADGCKGSFSDAGDNPLLNLTAYK